MTHPLRQEARADGERGQDLQFRTDEWPDATQRASREDPRFIPWRRGAHAKIAEARRREPSKWHDRQKGRNIDKPWSGDYSATSPILAPHFTENLAISRARGAGHPATQGTSFIQRCSNPASNSRKTPFPISDPPLSEGGHPSGISHACPQDPSPMGKRIILTTKIQPRYNGESRAGSSPKAACLERPFSRQEQRTTSNASAPPAGNASARSVTPPRQ